MKNLKPILESLIFTSGKPIEIKKLAKFTDVKEEEIKKVLEELQQEYKNQNRGLSLILQSNQVQMTSAPEFAEFVKKVAVDELQEDLSKASLETLSIITYQGPITRAAIEAIRGVNCVYILRNLLIRGLITKAKSEKDARMSIYEVSFDFLRHLGIRKVQDLPDYENLHKEVTFEEYIKEAGKTATKPVEKISKPKILRRSQESSTKSGQMSNEY
ncbi:MAG: SMC-Scp complex subunit ScpB [Patescibacteria group bacterium]